MTGRTLTCDAGRAVISANTERELFASAAGHCQRPACGRYVFEEMGDATVSVGEMAHIIAAIPRGPRGESAIGPAERAQTANLLLLCASCHTLVDKSPEVHTVALLQRWKQDHTNRINALFVTPVFATRVDARAALETLLTRNRVIFERYGPESPAADEPESDASDIWRRKVLQSIIPTNRTIVNLIDTNSSLLRGDERKVLEELRQHVDDLEARHVTGVISTHALRFPPGAADLFAGIGD